ncbi:hypothetical protein LTR84_007316 [Exophiala bonariae]|uniref:Uncharacterized protein n=1 Tax=Exophiala bonariae TaxID=1690606 RepID=A0AAV9MZ39_9EURO|nr:hypothetical protein LTR84_007316 [Exophiala bonariae]
MAEEALSAAPPEGAQANIGGPDGTKDQPQTLTPQTELAKDTKPYQAIQSSETTDIAAGSLTSPTSTQQSGPSSGPVPLDSPLRTTPIHPSLSSVKIPAAAVAGATEPNTNPVTLKPFTDAELSKYGFEKLRAHITMRKPGTEVGGGATPDSGAATGVGAGKANEEEIKKLRDETAALLKQKIDEREAKIREIEREMEEKEKIREVERKVFRKKLGGNAPATGSATPGPATTIATAPTTVAGAVDS